MCGIRFELSQLKSTDRSEALLIDSASGSDELELSESYRNFVGVIVAEDAGESKDGGVDDAIGSRRSKVLR